MCGRTRNNRPARTDKRGIDACLSSFIKLLNSKGIETTMSCCQHGAGKPWVVMPVNSFKRLLANSSAWKWIEEVHPTDSLNWWWRVTFHAEVCTPPRLDPCRNLTRKQVRAQRKAFGFERP